MRNYNLQRYIDACPPSIRDKRLNQFEDELLKLDEDFDPDNPIRHLQLCSYMGKRKPKKGGRDD